MWAKAGLPSLLSQQLRATSISPEVCTYPFIGNSSPDAVIRCMCCGDCLTVAFFIFDARCSWISDTDDPESNIISTVVPSSLPFITVAFGLIAATVTIHACIITLLLLYSAKV